MMNLNTVHVFILLISFGLASCGGASKSEVTDKVDHSADLFTYFSDNSPREAQVHFALIQYGVNYRADDLTHWRHSIIDVPKTFPKSLSRNKLLAFLCITINRLTYEN